MTQPASSSASRRASSSGVSPGSMTPATHSQQPRVPARGPRAGTELFDEHHSVAGRIDRKHRRDLAAFEDLAREHRSDAARELPVTQAVAVETKVAVVDDFPAHQLDIFVAHPTSSAFRLAKLFRTAQALAPHCTVNPEFSARPGRRTEISGLRPTRNRSHDVPMPSAPQDRAPP